MDLRLKRIGAWLLALAGGPVGSVLLALGLGAVVVAASGGSPGLAFGDLACGGFGVACGGRAHPAWQISETLVFSTPLILAGLAVGLAFQAGLFNIGAEGQLIAGAVAATVTGIHLQGVSPSIAVPSVLAAGALAGAAWGAVPGLLKAYRGAHEVVTTIMLNYTAQFLLEYLIVGGPLEQAGQSSSSPAIAAGARLPPLIPAARVFAGIPGDVYRAHTGLLVALVAAAAYWVFFRRTTRGYELRVVGESHRAARYSGIPVDRAIVSAMILSGALAGLAGAVQIAGLRHSLTDIYRPDTTGFDAIAVALLGGGTAPGIVLSALFFGGLHAGGQLMQSDAHISANLVEILQGLVLLSIAARFLRTLALRRASPAAEREEEP